MNAIVWRPLFVHGMQISLHLHEAHPLPPPAGSFAKESPNPPMPMPFCAALRQGSRLEVGGPRHRLVNITWLTFGLKGDTTIVHYSSLGL